MRTPATTSASVTARASSGLMPRKIATSGGAPAARTDSIVSMDQLQSAQHARIAVEALRRHRETGKRSLIARGEFRRADDKSRSGLVFHLCDFTANQQAGDEAARPVRRTP